MDHLQAIRIFARVVETGGFARAARSLNMPNATVSKWVQALEKHLGVKLLERSTRRVSVTTDGTAYYERTKHLISELDEVEATLGRSQASPRGVLRIETGGSTASGILIPALPDFCRQYPDIQLYVGVSDRTADVVGESIDCAIRSVASDPALITRRLAALRWTTCASPRYLARHRPLRLPKQLANEHSVVGYFSAATNTIQPLAFSEKGREFVVKVRNQVLVNESNAHLAAARAGLGVVHTLDFMVRPYIESGELVAVLEEWRPAPLEVYVVYPRSRQLSAKVRVFVDWILKLYARLAGP